MKEGLKTATLLFLAGLLLFLASKVWVEFPKFRDQNLEVSEFSSGTLQRQMVAPKKIIVNFSGKEHTQFYEVETGWPEYYQWIKEVFLMISDSETKPVEISKKEYIEAEEKRSVMFRYHRPWGMRIFMNMTGVEAPKETMAKDFTMETLYLPVEGNFILLESGEGRYYRWDLPGSTFPHLKEKVEDIYDSKRYRNYGNFYERYGILSDVYVPSLTVNLPLAVVYRNELSAMEKPFRNDLAERFLRRDIDYIREIIEDTGTTYVYETRNLRLNDDGLLEYQNLEQLESKEANLFLSLRAALEFIASRTGINSGLVLDRTESISNGTNNGYRLFFNNQENDKTVYLQKDTMRDYMVVEVYNQVVTRFRFLYRKATDTMGSGEQPLPGEISLYTVGEVLEKNKDLFTVPPGKDPLTAILEQLTDVDVAYVDPGRTKEPVVLLPAWEVTLGEKKYFFHMETGEFLLER